MRTAKVIAAGTANVIAPGTTAKLIALLAMIVCPGVQDTKEENRGMVTATEVATDGRREDRHDRLRELVRLHRLGTGAREVARLLQMSPTLSGSTGRR